MRVRHLLFPYLFLCAIAIGCSEDLSPAPPPPPPNYAGVDGYPAWSPDGSAIAYRRGVFSSQGPPGIYLINKDGTGNRLLLDETPFYEQGFVLLQEIRFSPDGAELAMTIGGEVFLLNVKIRSLHQLTSTGGNAWQPDWSPDGKYIVYRLHCCPTGIHIINVTSGEDRALLSGAQHVRGSTPRWSPQGEPIAYTALVPGGLQDIYTVHSDGTNLRRLTISGLRAYAEIPYWIDGGDRLLYAWRPSADPGGLQTRVMRQDGSDQTTWPLTFHLLTLISDAISSDSQQIVVPGIPPDSPDALAVLFIRDLGDVEGTTLRQLTSYLPPQDTSATNPLRTPALAARSRLLDAQRSVRKRDLGRERISRTGEQGLGQESLPALPEELLSRRDWLDADILRGRQQFSRWSNSRSFADRKLEHVRKP